MLLAVQGYSRPVQLAIGLLEAVAVVYAAGVESRRPSTANTWARTLQVGAPCSATIRGRPSPLTYLLHPPAATCLTIARRQDLTAECCSAQAQPCAWLMESWALGSAW